MCWEARPLNLTKHWGERYFQAGGPVDYAAVAKGGATVLNMHQGNVINPWINYPYQQLPVPVYTTTPCRTVHAPPEGIDSV